MVKKSKIKVYNNVPLWTPHFSCVSTQWYDLLFICEKIKIKINFDF